MNFGGAKLAILSRGRVLAVLRDDKATIPWPNCWDLPGGGREGDETPAACALRETQEEVGLVYPASAIHWARAYPRQNGLPGESWFMVLTDDGLDPARIRLGDEGQRWELMAVAEFLAHPGVVPYLAARLGDYLEARRA